MKSCGLCLKDLATYDVEICAVCLKKVKTLALLSIIGATVTMLILLMENL